MAKGQGLNSLIPQKSGDAGRGNQNQPPAVENTEDAGEDFEVENSLNNKERTSPDYNKEEFKKDINKNREIEDQAIFQIEVDKIKPNPYQPRTEYDDSDLGELANSIREVGIIQPLVLSKIEREIEGGTRVEYQLISGERRLRAAKKVGFDRVPAVVRREAGSRDKLSMALIENIQRSDLNPIETARAYSRLQEEFDLTQREIAAKVGKSRSTVANSMRLLKLPSTIQSAVSSRKINESQARLLLSIDDPKEQEEAFQKLMNDEMSTRDLRSKTKKKSKSRPKNSFKQKSSREERFWEQQLEDKLSAPVKISKKGGKGKITIKFFSGEEWRAVLDRLLEDD